MRIARAGTRSQAAKREGVGERVALLKGGAASAPAGVGDRCRQLWARGLVHAGQDDGVLDAEQLRDGRLDRVVRHRSAVRCGELVGVVVEVADSGE